MKTRSFAAFAVLCLLAAPRLQAGVTFDFSYQADDIANQTNWYNPTYGAFARTLLKKTMDDIGEELDSDAVITCEVQSYVPPPVQSFLAGATGLSAKQIGNLNEQGSFSKIVNGVDYNGPGADARIIWNFGRGFTGSSGMLAYIPYVYNHELGHVLYAVGGSSPIYTRFNSYFYDSLNRPWITNGQWTATGLIAETNDANSYFRALDGTHYQIYQAGDVSHLAATYYNHPFNNDDRRIMRTIGYKLVPRLNVAAGDGQIFLSWNPTLYATNYTIKRSTAVSGPYATIGTTTTATVFTDTGLANGTTYHYVVFATETGGVQTGNSMRKSATPTASSPSNLSFELPAVGLGQYAYNPSGSGWTFTASSGANGSGLTATYSAFSSANVTAPDGFQNAFLQGTAVISQTLNNLTPGQTYHLTFSASQRGNGQLGQTFDLKLGSTILGSYSPVQADAAGLSIPIYTEYAVDFVPTSASQVLSFVGTNLRGGDNTIFLDQVRITALATPANLSASTNGGNVTLTWTAVGGAISYNVKRSATSGGYHTTIATGVTTTNFSDTISNSAYYVVSAVNASGEGRDSSEASAILPVLLDAPTVFASFLSGNYAVIYWNPVPGATSYHVKRATTSGGPYTNAATGLSSSPFFEQISGPTYYVITGVYAGVEGKFSQEVLISPDQPSITLVLTNQQASISLATSLSGWNYQLQRSLTLAAGSWINVGSPQAGGGALNFSDPPDPTRPTAFYRILVGP
jgi:hypothetical protein